MCTFNRSTVWRRCGPYPVFKATLTNPFLLRAYILNSLLPGMLSGTSLAPPGNNTMPVEVSLCSRRMRLDSEAVVSPAMETLQKVLRKQLFNSSIRLINIT